MIALVTGASAGFGTAIARLLVEHGHKVIITARRQERLAVLQAELGDACRVLAFDITDEKATLDAVAGLPPEWQAIDLLVNNAGLALGIEPAQKSSLDDWKKMVATNINGLLTVTHAILPGMVSRNRGHIINLGSIAGSYAYPGGNVYGGTKAFVKQFSLNLRADLLGTAVRVSNIEPGLCGGTEFSNVRFHGDDAKAADLYADVDYITPQDIARTVVWIAECPAHMNVNRIEIMPVAQASAGLAVKKKGS
ncbi:NAD(P)-dependent oxidoreductase [Chelonobacter oris]|uniref:Malonic semialdehyde reductase n=1 Tax=Chelonobacter oris TaxID=505317 RepID=A0A0A3ATK9_9PAST|nr:SDR family oxidoreductase [Chelonobacter oris]KGQ71097.1 malonic semialdehyde reductase [Chelonobacter oris]MDH3000699.1 NAD(P)-dependent oxidoreductase [Chelonobacter oris]